MREGLLRKLGVYGYDSVEPVILAALAGGDPLLLVGRAGTGKTFLLNSLSEALGLEHRHYNASLIAFDDLVGFPWPEKDGGGIRYLETPATVWQAESVLVDEINRCKPEHQNRLFSLVHERRIQGLPLSRLRYRWAAMNPPGFDQGGSGEGYSGCEPLDSALADRFAFVVAVSDWCDLSEADRVAIADPRGEGRVSVDICGLRDFVEAAREKLRNLIACPSPVVSEYAEKVATALNQAGVRISPRRVRQLSRNLLALEAVCEWPRERLSRLGLEWSLPQRATGGAPSCEVVDAAHRSAWETVSAEGEERWLHEFHLLPGVDDKVDCLLRRCENRDTGTLAVSQYLAVAGAAERAVFALSLFPALIDRPSPPVGEEGLQDLGRVAMDILEVNETVSWRDGARRPYHKTGGGKYEGVHRDWARCEEALNRLKGRRRDRATQLFLHLLAKGAVPPEPRELEEKFHRCILLAKKHHATQHS